MMEKMPTEVFVVHVVRICMNSHLLKYWFDQGSFCLYAQPMRDDVIVTSSLIGWPHTKKLIPVWCIAISVDEPNQSAIWHLSLTHNFGQQMNGFVQDCSNSSALAIKLL